MILKKQQPQPIPLWACIYQYSKTVFPGNGLPDLRHCLSGSPLSVLGKEKESSKSAQEIFRSVIARQSTLLVLWKRKTGKEKALTIICTSRGAIIKSHTEAPKSNNGYQVIRNPEV